MMASRSSRSLWTGSFPMRAASLPCDGVIMTARNQVTWSNASRPASATLIEIRSIDYVPDAERHGGLASQFTLWLAANLQITAIVTGALAVVFGGDVLWSLVALLLGQVIGGAVMALHAAQGPQLGLPQMISSRVQFGVYGAILPIVAVCLMYIGFSASGCVLAGQATAQLLGVGEAAGIVIFSCLIVVVTLFGYRVIHGLGRVASVVGVVVFVYMFGRLFATHDVATLLAQRHFSLSKFLLAMSLSASWQIAYGPYVADYSRYLPRDASVLRVFAAVGLGSIIGSQISMTFGVFAAALAGAQFEHHEVGYIVGLGASGLAASLLYFGIAFGKVTVTSLNAYGSFMSMATMVSAFQRGVRIPVRHRSLYIVAMVGVSALLALTGRHGFLKAFESFILCLLAVFTPWERHQSGRLLLFHTLPLRRTGALRPERALWPLEHDWHRHLPDRHPRAGPLSRYGLLYRTAGRPARWGRSLVDPRAACGRGSGLSARPRLAAAP